MRRAVILGGSRTPFGSFMGSLADVSSVDLGALAVRHALAASGVQPESIDYVILGQVLTAGAGQMPARTAAVRAGIPMTVPALSLNKVCLSGIQAVILARLLVESGAADVIVAGGQESMSLAPRILDRTRSGRKFGALEVRDHLEVDGLLDAFTDESMGLSADVSARSDGFARESLELFAVESHRRAAEAWADGLMDAEVLDDVAMALTVDQSVRPDSSIEGLAKLSPSFGSGGLHTAGTSSPMNDGAAAVIVASEEWAVDHGIRWSAEIVAHGMVAGPDSSLAHQPSGAIADALRAAELRPADVDFFEINEAFASVVLTSAKDLGVGMDRVNIHGGALAIGHPLGASGARLVLHGAIELSRRGEGIAAVGLCGGGGQGDALILRANPAGWYHD